MTGQELQALLGDHQMLHSELQMDRSITAKEGGTPYGCYKQALRELHKRYRVLKEILVDRALRRVDIDELEEKIKANGETKFELCRNEIRHSQKQMQMEEVERTLADVCREFAHFYAQATALKVQIGELTPEKRRLLDEEMWRHHLKAGVALELLSQGHVSGETIALAQALPADFRAEIRDALSVQNGDRYKQHEVVKWFLDLQPVVLEPGELMPPSEVVKLLEQGF